MTATAADILVAAKEALRALSRDHRRGSTCEPCGSCPACSGVYLAVEKLSSAIERAEGRKGHVAGPAGSFCRHCRKKLPSGAMGNPDLKCPSCGRTARFEVTP